MNASPVPRGRAPLPDHVRVAVVGSGFAGLGAAIGLRRAGIRDVVVLERADELGGTWRDNAYPGCACDVPSHLYSFSFAPYPDWTHSFARQPQIQDYLVRTAASAGVEALLRFGAEVLGCRWDGRERVWEVTTARGTLTADVVVSATGPLSEPSTPSLDGLDSFSGRVFHSAAWDHGHDLRGRRVAVVGTGASAVQFVPHVQRRAERLTVFQRTAPWVLPRRDRRISAVERAAYRRVPGLQRLVRGAIRAGRESWVLGFSGRTGLLAVAERQGRRFLERSVPDPDLRARLTPTFALGCKRVLLSSDYYPALTQPNVEVVVDRIERVTPAGLVTVDGAGTRTEHAVDTIVLGTGFRVTDPPIAHRVVGSDGRTLAEHWAGTGMQAHVGMAVAGFPNFFHLLGPNTGLGHTSVVLMVETQVAYLVDLLTRMAGAGVATVEPRPQVQREWTDRVQAALAGTVWSTGGCSSWYLDDRGRNTTLWPTTTLAFGRRLARARLEDYALTPATGSPLPTSEVL